MEEKIKKHEIWKNNFLNNLINFNNEMLIDAYNQLKSKKMLNKKLGAKENKN